MIRRKRRWLVAAAGLIMAAQTGCQANIAGMTLPSGHYLEHLPQYFPEEPAFPLQRELAYQEETAGLLVPADRVRGVNQINPVPGVVPPPFGGPPMGGPPVPMPPPR